MSRISYSEDESYPGQFALWRGNVARSLTGRKGQRALRELEAALLAMPNKRLVANALADGSGDVCAVGALVVAKVEASEHIDRAQAVARVRREFVEACRCLHSWDQHDAGAQCKACRGSIEHNIKWLADHPESAHLFGPGEAKQCEAWDPQPVDADDDDSWLSEDEDRATQIAGEQLAGIPSVVAWRLIELNDMDLSHLSDEERYAAVLRWVQARIGATDLTRLEVHAYLP